VRARSRNSWQISNGLLLNSSPGTNRVKHRAGLGEWQAGAAPLVLRAFVCASPDGFTVMPGAWRGSPLQRPFSGFHAKRRRSKDTWVLETARQPNNLVAHGTADCRHERAAAKCRAGWPTTCFGWAATRAAGRHVRLLRCVWCGWSAKRGRRRCPNWRPWSPVAKLDCSG